MAFTPYMSEQDCIDKLTQWDCKTTEEYVIGYGIINGAKRKFTMNIIMMFNTDYLSNAPFVSIYMGGMHGHKSIRAFVTYKRDDIDFIKDAYKSGIDLILSDYQTWFDSL